MHFQAITTRDNWRQQAEELGYLKEILDNPPYWIEALPTPFCAVFSNDEIENTIKVATHTLTEAALAAVDYVCNSQNSDELFDKLCVPTLYRSSIRTSWNRRDPSLYGRFDFSYNNGAFKLLELNFDTPVTLYETSILQRLWLEDLKNSKHLPESAKQFNSLHADLIRAFIKLQKDDSLFHFSSMRNAAEEEGTTRYIESCAVQAGYKTNFLHIQALDYDSELKLIDQQNRLIKRLYKLYPWEDFLADDQKFVSNTGHSRLIPIITEEQTEFFEPLWKTLLSNKGILPILWEMNPDSPFLLPSYFEQSDKGQTLSHKPHVRKPLYGREGGSISIIYPDQPEKSITNPGVYGKEGYIVQQLHPLPEHENYHAVIGTWVIDSKPAGMGIRADLNRITTASHSVFVPHYVAQK